MGSYQTHLCQKSSYSSIEAATQCRPVKEAKTNRPHEIVCQRKKGSVKGSGGTKHVDTYTVCYLRPIEGCFFTQEKFRIGYPTKNYREKANKCVFELNRMAGELRRPDTFTKACTDPGISKNQAGCWIYRKRN